LPVINYYKEINKLRNELKEIKENYYEIKGLSFHHISGHAALIAGLIIMLILIVYMIRRINASKP